MKSFRKSFFSPKNFKERLLSVFILVLVLTGVSFTLNKLILDEDGMVALVISKVLVDYTNEDRARENLANLKVNPILEEAARLKAEDMISNGYFAHYGPDGKSPWYWLDKVGYDFKSAGENLALNFSESKDVNTAWMNSPKHRENIMNGKFTEIGIAVVDGMYKGKNTTFVVQFFGKPNTKVVTKKENSVLGSKNDNIISSSTKVSSVASTTVLGVSEEKDIIFLGIDRDLKDYSKKSFWQYLNFSWLGL